MADADEQAKLRSYLAAQSAKLTAAEIRARLDEAAQELLPAPAGADDGRGGGPGRRPPPRQRRGAARRAARAPAPGPGRGVGLPRRPGWRAPHGPARGRRLFRRDQLEGEI